MDIRPIRTDADYDEAAREVERLWGAAPGSPDGDKLDVLATLLQAYDDAHHPVADLSPVEVLAYAVTEMGRSQRDLAELLGSRSQASDLLLGRRRISLDLAQKISAAWRIPIQMLVKPYDLTKPGEGGQMARRGRPKLATA